VIDETQYICTYCDGRPPKKAWAASGVAEVGGAGDSDQYYGRIVATDRGRHIGCMAGLKDQVCAASVRWTRLHFGFHNQ
jgi:hypothetical protein